MSALVLGLLCAGGGAAACLCCDCECCEPNDDWNILQEAIAGERGAGWLNKRAKSKPIWSKRFFVLTDSKLIYYTDVDRQNSRGEIVMAGAIAAVSTTRKSGKKAKYFTISHPECGEREFYARTSNRRNQWINAINELSAKLQGVAVYGRLLKQGGLTKSSWQERWSICAGSSLDYFDNPTENQPKGSIDLTGAKVKDVSCKDQKYAFELAANNDGKKGSKKYVFAVEKEGDKKMWMDALIRASDPNARRLDDSPAGGGATGAGGGAAGGGSAISGVNPIHRTTSKSSTGSASSSGAMSRDIDEGGLSLVSLRGSTSTPEEMKGYLFKKSPHALQGYQKRYFVLRAPGELAYYGSEEDVAKGVEPKGVISLKDVDSDNGVQFVDGKSDIVLVCGKRSYPLRANNSDEAESWATALSQWSARAK